MGQCDGGIYLVESVADVARLAVAIRRRARLRDADDALGGRRGRDRRGAEASDSRGSSARRRTTSATRRRTGRTRSSSWCAQVDVVIVVGSPNSSNSNRLREVAANRGVPVLHGRPRRPAAIPSGSPARPRRRHGRRVGARGAGAGSARAARRAGRNRRRASSRASPSASCSRCPRVCTGRRRRRRRKSVRRSLDRPGAAQLTGAKS